MIEEATYIIQGEQVRASVHPHGLRLATALRINQKHGRSVKYRGWSIWTNESGQYEAEIDLEKPKLIGHSIDWILHMIDRKEKGNEVQREED